MRTKQIRNFLLNITLAISVLPIFTQECPPADTLAVTPVQNLWQMPFLNDWQGLEVMTWNVKEFPQTGNTVSYMNEIISDLQPDIIVFQEITNLVQFQVLINSLNAYSFIHTDYESDDGFTPMNLGLAVRSDSIDILDNGLLFTGFAYEFAWRYPLMANLHWHCGLAAMDFQIIVVHFKCCDNGFDRRLASSAILHNYIINEMSSGGQQNIIVAGDFNDDPDDPESGNSLWPLLDDPYNMTFVTLPILGDPNQQSYPWYWTPSFLDHILISSTLFDENTSATIQTFRPDDYMGSSVYQQHISDHRPVIWSSTLEMIDVPVGIVINEIMNNPAAVSDTYGEWFELTNTGPDIILLDGMIIQDGNTDSHTIQSDGALTLLPGEFIVLGRNGDPLLNGDVTINYVYSGINLNNTWDGITIQHPSGLILDQVYYDNGVTFPNAVGASMMLTDPMVDNSLGGNWVVSGQLMTDGDFGTPGSANVQDSCLADGDVTEDGTTDVLDVVSVVGYILGNIPFTDDQICSADMNIDGQVNVSDIVILVSVILN